MANINSNKKSYNTHPFVCTFLFVLVDYTFICLFYNDTENTGWELGNNPFVYPTNKGYSKHFLL